MPGTEDQKPEPETYWGVEAMIAARGQPLALREFNDKVIYFYPDAIFEAFKVDMSWFLGVTNG